MTNALRKEVPVAIVGAGVCGLALAYRLKDAGVPYLLLEQQETVGGYLRTTNSNGFLLEFGPNSSLNKRAFCSLVEELGLGEQLVEPQPQAARRYLVLDKNQGLLPVPQSVLSALCSPLLSPRGKLRALAEPWFGGSETSCDRSVWQVIAERFGSECAEHIVAPMLSGIWAADITKLSCEAALAQLWQLNKQERSLLFSAVPRLFSAKGKSSRTRPKILSFRLGMQTLTDVLYRALSPESLLSKTKLLEMAKGESTWELRCEQKTGGGVSPLTIQARTLVLTTPARQTANLLTPHQPKLASLLRDVPHASVGLLHLSCEKVRHALDGFGFLVAPKAGLACMGAIFSSSLFPNRAPEGQHLLTCFVGGAHRPELADVHCEETQTQVIDELRQLLGIEGAPEVIAATVRAEAIPNYPLGHSATQRLVAEFTAAQNAFGEREHKPGPQLHILGNWLKGISIDDRICQANEIAERIIRAKEDDSKRH